MKVIGVLLLLISSSLSFDYNCEDRHDGNCKNEGSCSHDDIIETSYKACPSGEDCCVKQDKTPCAKEKNGKCRNKGSCENDELELTYGYLCLYSEKACCVDKDPCDTEWGGTCEGSCDSSSNEIELNEKNLCIDSTKICCVKDKPVCGQLYDGKCRKYCNANDDETRIPELTNGLKLCEDKEQCCVENYECQMYVKNGVCRRGGCLDEEATVTIIDFALKLCVNPGYKCCFVPDACNIDYIGGTCRDVDECPPGEIEASKRGKQLPVKSDIPYTDRSFDDWCERSNFKCCVKEY